MSHLESLMTLTRRQFANSNVAVVGYFREPFDMKEFFAELVRHDAYEHGV